MSLMTAVANDTIYIDRPAPAHLPSAIRQSYVDPLDDDAPSDDVVVTTRRAISRVALVATETGSRFQREGVSHDPMTWMMAPRALFGGATALDACLEREQCLRGILLHGLSIGLDAEPSAIDALAADDDYDDGADVAFDPGAPHGPRSIDAREGPSSEVPRLFTATVVAFDGFETVQAFHASLATEEAEIAGRLYMRMGAAMADAVIVEGFDPTAPLVAALLSPAICDTLALVAADPSSPLAAGLDLNVEQRFLA